MKYKRRMPSVARCREQVNGRHWRRWRCALTVGHSGSHQPLDRADGRVWRPRYVHWHDIPYYRARRLNLSRRMDIQAPRNELGERCPWPWEPGLLWGAPLGQYRCNYCYAMCVAGIPHLDYGDDWFGEIDAEETPDTVVEETDADNPF